MNSNQLIYKFKDKGRVKDVLHASFCSKNGRIKKETKLNPQLRFWQVLNKYCVFCFFNIELISDCSPYGEHCGYAWAAPCINGQLCGLLCIFVASVSLRTSLSNSSPNTLSTWGQNNLIICIYCLLSKWVNGILYMCCNMLLNKGRPQASAAASRLVIKILQISI